MSVINVLRRWVWNRTPVIKALNKDHYRAFSTSQRCMDIQKNANDERKKQNKHLIGSSIAVLTGFSVLMLFCWEKKSVHAANGRKKVLPPRNEEDQTHPIPNDIHLGRQIKLEVKLCLVEEDRGKWVPPQSNKTIKEGFENVIQEIRPEHLGRNSGTLVTRTTKKVEYRIDNQGSFERNGETYDNIQAQVRKETYAIACLPKDQGGEQTTQQLQEALDYSLKNGKKMFLDKFPK